MAPTTLHLNLQRSTNRQNLHPSSSRLSLPLSRSRPKQKLSQNLLQPRLPRLAVGMKSGQANRASNGSSSVPAKKPPKEIRPPQRFRSAKAGGSGNSAASKITRVGNRKRSPYEYVRRPFTCLAAEASGIAPSSRPIMMSDHIGRGCREFDRAGLAEYL
jgi:hypothetical protein